MKFVSRETIDHFVNALPYVIIGLLSGLAFAIYFPSGLNLPYADAISRLDIARKVVDNLTPGIAQLGSVWLPLPQILMIPLIWNDYMWHSGLAGSIMSMGAFVFGGIYVYKSAKLISNSSFASLCSLFVYGLNINLLYLQTTAMSESLFVCMLAMSTYYFLKWFHTNKWTSLAMAGVAITGITLTRYEGLPMLFASIPMVLFYSILKQKKFSRIEGHFLIFIVAAGFGFGLWTLYLTLIFRDPLFWIHYYATAHTTQQVGETVVKTYSQSKPFLAAFWQYFTSVSWMTGIISTALAVLSIPLMFLHSLRKKNWYFLPMLLPASIFLFMILTLQRNTPIIQPELSIANIMRPDTSMDTGFNIRYGLMIHSWLAVLSVYIFMIPGVNIIMLFLFLLQVGTYYRPDVTLVYQIPMRIYGKPYNEIVDWMKKNYRGGPIFISASGFEDQMFAMGFPYRYYIHEGTNKYWKEALDHPARYASYVIFDPNHPDDRLAKELKTKPYWSWFYNVVYDSTRARIYEVKTKPDIEIASIPKFTPRPKEPSPYVSLEGKTLIQNGKPFPYVKRDLTDLVYQKEEDILTALDQAAADGITVIRVWAFGEGEKDGFMPESYTYNKVTFNTLGFVVSEARKRNLFVLMTLSNYDNEHGGIFQYLRWDGLPNTTPEQKDMFFTHQFPRNRFREYINNIVAYKNPFTGLGFPDDTTVFGWELMNNPQVSAPDKQVALDHWFAEMSSVVAHYDPHHIILTGQEGQ